MHPTFDVSRLAALSQLSLSPEEEAELRQDLIQIHAFVSQVSSVPAVPPLPERSACPLREDLPRSGLSREESLSMAPLQESGFFSVPSVMEEATDEHT